MSENNILDDEKISYYSIKNIILGFIIGGGPFTAGFLIYKNCIIANKIIIGVFILAISIIIDAIWIFFFFWWVPYHLLLFIKMSLIILLLYISLYIIFQKYILRINEKNKYFTLGSSIKWGIIGLIINIIFYIIMVILFVILMLRVHSYRNS